MRLAFRVAFRDAIALEPAEDAIPKEGSVTMQSWPIQ